MTSPTELVITLPLPPTMANSRMHWREKHRQRVAYLEHCDIVNLREMPRLVRDAGAPRRASLAFVLHVGNPMDDDNALARTKFACDWLVMRGFLVDDSRKWCKMSIPSQVITRDKNKQRLEIYIQYQDSQ